MDIMKFLRKKGFHKKSEVTVNGKTITLPANANNVSIVNDKVYVNGKLFEDIKGVTQLTIDIDGELQNLEVKGEVVVTCNTIKGNVTASNYVTANIIEGDVKSGNYVKAGIIKGNVQADNYVKYEGK